MNKIISLTGALCAVVMVSACDITTPSAINESRIQVQESIKTEAYHVSDLDRSQIQVIAGDFEQNGSGDVTVLVTYDSDKSKAMQNASNLKKLFVAEGMNNVVTDVFPVTDESQTDKVVVSYRAWNAKKPKGCTPMPGSYGGETTVDAKLYRVGCGIDDMIARQISRPTDLLGKGGLPDGDSRRQGTVTEPYKAGTPNEALEGLTASDVGSN